MIDKEWRFKVIVSACSTFKSGDILKPIKQTKVGVLIGFDYRKSLYFDRIDDVTYSCMSMINPGIELVRIERIK